MNIEDKSSIVAYRFNRAKETLNEIEVLIEQGFLNNAINRTYYACFYAVSALLLDNGILSKSHSGTKQMFGLHFIKTGVISNYFGEFYSVVFDMRQNGDYSDFFVVDKDEVIALFEPAQSLISQIEYLLSINRLPNPNF